jgi:uncharacterized protein (DUF1330 family)
MEAVMKKGYWMAMVDVTDEANYPKYIAANKAAFDKYGAKFLVRGGQGQVFEGPAASRLVVIEFDSYEQARAWYDSQEYAGPKALRQETSTGRVILVDGY